MFREGRAEHLDVPDESLGGVLAWYSLIHTPPASLGAILGEFARCLRPGGRLLIGFCEGPELVAFDHAVTTAYYWPIDLLSARIEQAGFVVTDTQARHDPGSRPHGAITAERRS